jgi:ribosomal 50S subunit-recycling heat shock protein
MTRLDIFLKNTGLIKRRSEAKSACQRGSVQVNDRPANAGRPVRVGETIRVELTDVYFEVEVLAVPERPPPKSERRRYYRLIRHEPRRADSDFEF